MAWIFGLPAWHQAYLGTRVVAERGPVQGWLEWTFEQAENKMPRNARRAFCYANSGVRLRSYVADYSVAELLRIPAGASLEQAFLAQSTSYQLPHAPEEAFMAQTPQEERAMWHSLPEPVRARWFG